MRTFYKKWDYNIIKIAKNRKESLRSTMKWVHETLKGNKNMDRGCSINTAEVMKMEYHILNGGLHIFIDTPLRDFLIASAPKSCDMRIARHVLSEGTSKFASSIGTAVVHTPQECFFMFACKSSDILNVIGEGTLLSASGVFSDNANYVTDPEDDDIKRMVLSMSAMWSAFPEAFVSGFPQDGISTKFKKTKNSHICPPKALFDSANITTPHFRRGHWRFLKSEKFTKKQGEVVFVKDCFVKGSAEHMVVEQPV